jgi:CRISPR-associated protein Csd1
MLLKALYDFAESNNLLDDSAFVQKPVRWVIQLDKVGQLVGDGLIENHLNEKKKALEFSIPKTTRPTGSGQVSDFLADDIGALFNLNTKPEQDQNQRAINNLRCKYEDFWCQINVAFLATNHYAFSALNKFHAQLQGKPPPFLRLDSTGTPKWMIRKADGSEVKLVSDLLTFSVEGNILINDDEVVRPYWRQVHASEMSDSEKTAPLGICLITGKSDMPIARTHTPMVTGLPKPARGTGAGIVGFEGDSFCSYGFKQSFNASVSINASKGYLAAIQYLSGQEDHWLAVGPAWLCFWAKETEAVSNYFARLLKQPDSKTIREFLVTPWKGFPQPPNNLERFIAITLSAAGPRIIVKDWLQLTVRDAEINFKKWFEDLEIISYGGNDDSQDERSPLSVDQLACTTIGRKSDGKFDRDKLNPDLIATLYRAALKNESLRINLLTPVLGRLKANIAKNGLKALYDQSRFALIKLMLNRHKRNEEKPEMQPQLFETNDPAYNCGRLLAVLDSLQRSAHGKNFDGATIAERYFGAASTTPNTAFSLLWKLHQHHLKKLRQQGENGQRAANKIRASINEIAILFEPATLGASPQFPRYFNLIEQGRFALGFYQQMAARKSAIDEYLRKKKAGELKPEEVIDELDLADNE